MAQTVQIVPKYTFPYVETVINDYTVVDTSNDNSVVEDPAIYYIIPFVSSKGIDNYFIKKRTREDFVASYGDSNYKKYGQPLMQALNIAEEANTAIWCMRVMPENATYAHNVISGYFKGDTSSDVADASKRKFRIKFVQKHAGEDSPIISKSDLDAFAAKLDGETSKGVYKDAEGYTQVPGLVKLWSAGRGRYGNNYRLRVAQDVYYEKDYGIKFYDFEIISTETGFDKTSNYVGATVTSPKYNAETLINDILDDQEAGVVPVYVYFDEDGVEDIYDAYNDWCKALVPDLQKEYTDKLSSYGVSDAMVDGTANVPEDKLANVEELRGIKGKINYASTVVDLDAFDVIFGRDVASTDEPVFIKYPAALTSDIDTKAEGYNAADYTSSDIVSFDSVAGIKLYGGSDGYFEKPRVEKVVSKDGTIVNKQWTVEDEIQYCYKKAFSGDYDKRVLVPERIRAHALWDANYSFEVKSTMADLTILRNDALCYLDCGIQPSFTDIELKQMIKDYSVFTDNKISKNIQFYYVKEPTTKKRVPVTITYFLSRKFASHQMDNGFWIPLVKTNAQLSGHVKDSLYPTVEAYEVELKETLVENRFNYFETVDDNTFQRATQNTAQSDTSDLLEENNVTILYTLKREIEKDISDELYDFSDADTRASFKQYETAKFASWVGSRIQALTIDFTMNEWEAERSILHCYLGVTFRGLQKRGILEIDINKRTNTNATASTIDNATLTAASVSGSAAYSTYNA